MTELAPRMSQQARPQGHSRLTQKEIRVPTDATDAFRTEGSDIPLVLVVKPRGTLSCAVSAPTEHRKLWTVSNKLDPKQTSENMFYHWRFFNTRISHVVNGQNITYECPVTQCPTKDNVMINVDITVNFKIIAPSDFVFKLGAHAADELITGGVEEGTRVEMRKRTVAQVKAMQGNQAGDLMTILRTRAENCGISFDNVKVTRIRLPGNMESALQATTEMNAALRTIEKKHTLSMTEARQRANLAKERLERENDRLITEQGGLKRQAEQQSTVDVSHANTVADESKTQAEEQCEVMKLNATAEKERAKRAAETKRAQELNQGKEDALQIRLVADEDLKIGVLDSIEELAQAERKAKEIQLKAEVESSLAEQIRLQRAHELGLAQKNVLAVLAEKGHYNLVGGAGDMMLKSMMEGDFNIDDFSNMRI